MTSPPPPHWLPLTADKWTKCLLEFSGPGSRVGAIISNDHKLSPTSLEWRPNIHHRTSVPVFPGSWGCSKTWSGSHHQDASWGAGAVAAKLQMMITRTVSVVSPPQLGWLMPQTFHQAAKHSSDWSLRAVYTSVGLPPSIDVKQHQTQHVSQLPSHA